MMKGYVAISIKLPTAELTSYIGITEAKLPKEFHLSNVVAFPNKTAYAAPRQNYLRTPNARFVGAKVFPNALRKVGALGRGAAGPVFLHVGTTFVEPTGAAYEPTEGATTDPYPPSPGACASANVLVRVKAVASAIVESFMIFSLSNR
jgi:hypothetical protein